ncbi:MAG: NAD+ synthase [Oxalobacter sp.]|nr:NAD+ synthase [Oxalobacter sp.]
MLAKIAIAQMNSTVGDFSRNRQTIRRIAQKAAAQGADIVLTPELSLTGYSPEDLLRQQDFYDATQQALSLLKEELRDFKNLHVIVGHHQIEDGKCYNACSVLVNGEIIGTYSKQVLATDSVFDERRYFSAGDKPLAFSVKGTCFGILINEDICSPEPAEQAKAAGADSILILNSSHFKIGKMQQRYDAVRNHLASIGLTTVYANMTGGQDELVFDGNSFAMDKNGNLCIQLKHCQEDFETVICEQGNILKGRIEENLVLEEAVYKVLVMGVKDYIGKNGFPGAIIGLSGGVDSALVLAIAHDALGKDKVRAVMMPSQYTSDISNTDAADMAKRLDVRCDTLPITTCFSAFNQTLAAQFSGLPEDVTEENLQARIRGTLLMALSNKTGSIVLTTGNKSETAVGYCTLYGDTAGGFAVIKDIYKTLVYRLCRYRNTVSDVIPERILTRPPSAELKPGQCDQDSLPPYETLDGILRLFMEEQKTPETIIGLGYSEVDVNRIVSLLRRSEYKRRQAPIGIQLTARGFGGGWHYPITSKFHG